MILNDCFISITPVAFLDPFEWGVPVEYSGQGTSVAIVTSTTSTELNQIGTGVLHPVTGEIIQEATTRIGDELFWAMELEFVQDESISGQAWFDMLGELIQVEVRPTSGPRSISNPAYVGTAVVTNYTPLRGSFGSLSTASLSLEASGDLQRLVTV